MNKKQKIILAVIIIFLVLVIGITIFFAISNKNKEEKITTMANDNAEVIKERTINGLKISHVTLIIDENGSTFSADVTNTTSQEINNKSIEVIFKTSTGKTVISLLGSFGNNIKPGETKQISTSTSRKLNKNIIKSVGYKLV